MGSKGGSRYLEFDQFFGEHVDQLKIRSSDEETKNWSKIKIAAKKKKKMEAVERNESSR